MLRTMVLVLMLMVATGASATMFEGHCVGSPNPTKVDGAVMWSYASLEQDGEANACGIPADEVGVYCDYDYDTQDPAKAKAIIDGVLCTCVTRNHFGTIFPPICLAVLEWTPGRTVGRCFGIYNPCYYGDGCPVDATPAMRAGAFAAPASKGPARRLKADDAA